MILALLQTVNSTRYLWSIVKGWAQNRGLFDRKFKIVRIGRFWRLLCHWTRKICGISWVIIKNSRHKNSAYQLTQNSNVDWNFYSKFGKISNIEWAPQIKMDLAQYLRKKPNKGQKQLSEYFGTVQWEKPSHAFSMKLRNISKNRFYENAWLDFSHCSEIFWKLFLAFIGLFSQIWGIIHVNMHCPIHVRNFFHFLEKVSNWIWVLNQLTDWIFIS